MLQMKLPYITFFILSFKTWSLRMKKIVLVAFTLLPTPWASLPNSLAADLFYISLCLGFQMSRL
jgi:hypothetical protein